VRAQGLFLHGDLVHAQSAAENASRHYFNRDPVWAWKFRVLHAEILAWRGMYPEILKVLELGPPPELDDGDLNLERQIWTGTAYIRLHRFDEAQKAIAVVSRSCIDATRSVCGELYNIRGALELEHGNYEAARSLYSGGVAVGRDQHNRFLEAWSLLNLTQVALLEEHFDEAVDYADETYKAASSIDAQGIILSSQGNLGWARYMTGDADRAIEIFLNAVQRARSLGSLVDEITWLTASGYIYLDQGNFPLAEDLYRKALNLATDIKSQEDILNAQISLAFVSLLTDKLDLARQYSDQAIASARANGRRIDELYPLLTKGQIAVHQGNFGQAEQIFREVASDPKVSPSLKWEAQHELANLYADQKLIDQAQGSYRTALVTFENARSSLQHEDVRLPFLANASSLYEDYIRLLLSQGKVADALSAADHARARTLSEGLGQLKKTESVLPPPVDGPRIARAAGGSILYYWLGQKQSYLWAITPQKTTLYPLPAAPQIDVLVKRYRKSLERPQEGIETQNADGVNLYRMLVQPAEQIIGKSSKIFIIPDGTLNGLNFETLIVPGPKLHYWIEDTTITNASALRLLERTHSNSTPRRANLLLVGNPVTASPEFVTPPQAATEMTKIREHFSNTDQRVFSGIAATPPAYLSSKPEQFGYIHFVAHGTASRLSPLDSAIVLSRTTPQDDSFRLYARAIIQKPLRAELVTISACYGAGTRAYSGEGLVGLSWAFLRAGAHNVIAALWDVSDASTPQLMDQMYLEIRKGKRPEEALRSAKLTLLHSDTSFHNPFYWAPFQLYTGS
jgi:CHAT domain-containing protein